MARSARKRAVPLPGAGTARLVGEAERQVRAAPPAAPRDAIPRSPAARSCAPRDGSRTARTRSSAISASMAVAAIGCGSVTACVTERRSAEADAHRDGPPGRALRPQPRADPVGEVAEHRPDDLAPRGFRPSADCAPTERARRWVRIARGSWFQASAASFSPARTAEQAGCQRPRRALRQLADGGDAALGESRPGRRTDAPHQLDRQIVQEGELGPGIDDHQPVGLGDLRGDLGEVLRARHADGDRQSRARRARGGGSPRRSRPAGRRDACSPRHRRTLRRSRSAPPAA